MKVAGGEGQVTSQIARDLSLHSECDGREGNDSFDEIVERVLR